MYNNHSLDLATTEMFKFVIVATAVLAVAFSLTCKSCGQVYYSKTGNEWLKNISETMEPGMALCSAPANVTCNATLGEELCIDYEFTVK